MSTGATTVTCAPEPITAHRSHLRTRATPTTAELKPTTYLKKQADLYLQQRELEWDFAGSSVPFCTVHLNWLLWINETKRLFGSEEIWRRTDNIV